MISFQVSGGNELETSKDQILKKVRGMIEAMIERLLAEAGEEADAKAQELDVLRGTRC